MQIKSALLTLWSQPSSAPHAYHMLELLWQPKQIKTRVYQLLPFLGKNAQLSDSANSIISPKFSPRCWQYSGSWTYKISFDFILNWLQQCLLLESPCNSEWQVTFLRTFFCYTTTTKEHSILESLSINKASFPAKGNISLHVFILTGKLPEELVWVMSMGGH